MPEKQDLINHRKVATACKEYVDKTKEEILDLISDYNMGSETESQLSTSATAPNKDIRSTSLIEIGGNSVKYAPSTATDDTSYKDKSIPNNTYTLGLDYIGGMSYKSENLIVLNDVAETTYLGITYKVQNGVIYLNGLSQNEISIYFTINEQVLNGTYYYYVEASGTYSNSISKAFRYGTTNIVNLSDNNTISASNKNINRLLIYIPNATTITNYVYKPMLVSGSTAPSEFKVGFEGIRDTKTTSVVVSGQNQTPITKQIPAEIQALDGYGYGINSSVYNYVDFDNKKFVKKVGRVKAKDLNWYSDASNRFYAVVSGLISTLNQRDTNVLCVEYTSATDGSNMTIFTYSFDTTGTTNRVVIYDNRFNSNPTNFKNHFTDDDYIYYETTPIETDISAYLPSGFNNINTNNNYTDVELANEYNQDMPNKVSFYGTIKDTLVDSLTIDNGNGDTSSVVLTDYTIESDSWSVSNSIYNYRAFRDDERHKVVGRIDIGTMTWTAGQIGTSGVYRMTSTDISTLAKGVSSSTLANILCNKYETKTANNTYSQQVGISLDSSGNIWVYDENYNTSTSASVFKQAMSGVYLYYELAQEEITPLNLPSEFHRIATKGNGTTTFNNDNNQACHNTLRYYYKEVKSNE